MQRENANIEAWVRNDIITVTPGNVTDYDYIIRDIAELSEIYDITAIAYDPWNSSTIVPKLVEQGANMQPFTQTISNYAMPTKEFERIVGLGIVDHYDNPVARWMLSNVVIREDVNGNRRPDKKKSSEKIDGIVAAIMALGQSMSDKVTEQHIYERRGILGFDDDDDTIEDNNLYDYDNDEY
jgi:phage terminase large subunit-like protein